MWTIRQEQAEAFRQNALRNFEEEMVEHLQKFAPNHWKAMGEPVGREVIRTGIENAERYGFTNRGPVRFYIELMLTFGSFFDTDPQYPWARSPLMSFEELDQTIRADALYRHLNTYIARVLGQEDVFFKAALRRAYRVFSEEVGAVEANLELHLLWKAKAIYPEACEYLGEAVIHDLIRHGFELAEHYRLVIPKGVLLLTALTFALGYKFDVDPVYAWVARIISDPEQPNPGCRIERVCATLKSNMPHLLPEDSR